MGRPLPSSRRPASAAAPPKPSAAKSSAAPAGWLKRGPEVFQKAKEEQERNKERAERRKNGLDFVHRFFLEKGGSAGILILDSSIDDAAGLYEHEIYDPRAPKGQQMTNETCCKEFAHCAVCDADKESNYVMFLSVISFKGFDRKSEGGGKEHVDHSRELLPIKMGQIEKWKKWLDGAQREFGTIRGVYMVLERGIGDTSYKIGEPTLLETNKLFDFYTEDDIVANWDNEQETGRDGKTVIKQAHADITPYDYEQLFQPPDPEDLNRRYGTGGNTAGSAKEAIEEFGGEAEEQEEAAAPAKPAHKPPPGGVRKPAPSAPPTGTRTRTRPAPAKAPDPEPETAEGEEEPFET